VINTAKASLSIGFFLLVGLLLGFGGNLDIVAKYLPLVFIICAASLIGTTFSDDGDDGPF